jgi:hypothetical protein
MNFQIEWTKKSADSIRSLLYSRDDRCYYVVSTRRNFDGDFETLVFPAHSTGKVIEHTEVAGGRDVSHDQAIDAMRAITAEGVCKRLDA